MWAVDCSWYFCRAGVLAEGEGFVLGSGFVSIANYMEHLYTVSFAVFFSVYFAVCLLRARI